MVIDLSVFSIMLLSKDIFHWIWKNLESAAVYIMITVTNFLALVE